MSLARLRSAAFFLFAAALFCLAPRPAAAQAGDTVALADTLREIRLADGSVVYGRIVAAEGETVTIRTVGEATLEVPRAQIVSAAPLRGRLVDGEVLLPDPNPSRLFFVPRGLPVPGGSGYFGVYELFFPFVTYGVTDAISITGGTPIIPGAIGRVGYFGGKATFVKRSDLQVAAGFRPVLYGGDRLRNGRHRIRGGDLRERRQRGDGGSLACLSYSRRGMISSAKLR